MFVAQKKKKENIIEYLLYMWQIEDLIRSCNFDIKLISESVINKSPYSNVQKSQLKDWYLNLMYKMESEGIQEYGHMQDLQETLHEVEQVHNFLINIAQLNRYQKLLKSITPLLRELRNESNEEKSDLSISLEFIYGVLLLKLQGKAVAESTMEALKQITLFTYELAENYKDYKQGFLSISKAQKN